VLNKKNKGQRRALLVTAFVFVLLGGACLGLLVWASQAEDSAFAQSIRQTVGISEPSRTQSVKAVPTPAPPPPVVQAPVAPEPEPVIVPEPEPLPGITMAEISQQRELWPQKLTLKYTKQVPIRYNGNHYGYMEFSKDTPLVVDALRSNGEVFCVINGNYLSLSVHETNFVSWFETTYAERYRLEPIVFDDRRNMERPRHRLGTPEGDAAFWAEIRIWCQQNYDSVSLKIEDDNLVFRWLPKEDAPIDFNDEAREIARNFLIKRDKYGGNDNYAACEIRDPVTDALMGASSMFIPWL